MNSPQTVSEMLNRWSDRLYSSLAPDGGHEAEKPEPAQVPHHPGCEPKRRAMHGPEPPRWMQSPVERAKGDSVPQGESLRSCLFYRPGNLPLGAVGQETLHGMNHELARIFPHRRDGLRRPSLSGRTHRP